MPFVFELKSSPPEGSPEDVRVRLLIKELGRRYRLAVRWPTVRLEGEDRAADAQHGPAEGKLKTMGRRRRKNVVAAVSEVADGHLQAESPAIEPSSGNCV